MHFFLNDSSNKASGFIWRAKSQFSLYVEQKYIFIYMFYYNCKIRSTNSGQYWENILTCSFCNLGASLSQCKTKNSQYIKYTPSSKPPWILELLSPDFFDSWIANPPPDPLPSSPEGLALRQHLWRGARHLQRQGAQQGAQGQRCSCTLVCAVLFLAIWF